MSTTHRCHECQHLATHGNQRAFCAKKHKIAYEFPADATATDFGFRAVGKGCGDSFTLRDSSYYLRPVARPNNTGNQQVSASAKVS